jgi:hypothetical protein
MENLLSLSTNYELAKWITVSDVYPERAEDPFHNSS